MFLDFCLKTYGLFGLNKVAALCTSIVWLICFNKGNTF